MIDRYSRKELKAIWSEENKYKIWLDIEVAAAEIAVPERLELKNKIFQLNDKLEYFMNNLILSNKDLLNTFKKLLKSPQQIYNSYKEKFENN